ncbi:VCBS domain-containing protein [Nocardioides houyundeii]|uniref:VCBS domain-containing protein n=1 Tax=Nocardioides houyundeii TaxID=2045452 RepID=UPI000DF2D621|nr:VCBS domain-containing protein [Nocardioides houyundeii]
MRTSALRRSIAAGASVAVAAVGMASFAPAAQAESAKMTFNCKLLGGLVAADFTTVADTTLPASVSLGSSTQIDFSATITVPESTANTARTFGETVQGSAAIATTVDGQAAAAAATLPSTNIAGTTGALALKVTGSSSAPYVADKAGKKTVKLASYTADLVFVKAATGTQTKVDVVCNAAADANTTVDTFNVVDPNAPVQKTTTDATAVYKKKAKKVVAKVEVLNADDTAATGDVKLVLKKGNKKVGKAVTVSLNKKGKAKNVFTKVTKKGKYTLKVNFKGSDASKKSNAKVKLVIK